MNRKALLLAGAVAATMLGCASAQQPSGTPRPKPLKPISTTSGPYPQDRYSAAYCDRDRCTTTVSVNEKCEISVDPQWMGIKSNIPSPMLVFVLKAPAGFSFPDDAIFDKMMKPGAPSPFQIDRSSTATEFRVLFKPQATPGIYHYGIKVKKGDQVCEILDPPIITDM
jgi:hypothetical protein